MGNGGNRQSDVNPSGFTASGAESDDHANATRPCSRRRLHDHLRVCQARIHGPRGEQTLPSGFRLQCLGGKWVVGWMLDSAWPLLMLV